MDRPPPRAIRKLLVANRGEIATRILSAARELEIETYALYTPDDATHTLNATHAVALSSPASYLDISELLAVVKHHKIDAIHPGYGFLSESAEFVQRMWEDANAVVVGPGWGILARTGDKLQARVLAEECAVPVLPAMSRPTDEVSLIRDFAAKVGYPIIIKAVDGGGGRGIRIVRKEEDLESLMGRALKESPCRMVFAEKAAIEGYRHVEVQIVGDGKGAIRHLWERECSIQRRFQKVVEFAPSSIGDRELVGRVIEAALRMAKKVNYLSLGTFEFLVRPSSSEFYFLEVNPRLQVEHTITESICNGIDLVQIQLQIASGASLSSISSLNQLPTSPLSPPLLCSIQLRVTAENPSQDWSLSVGKVASFRFPTGNGIRIDTHLLTSPQTIVKTDFDSLLAKIIVTASNWEDVVGKAKRALADTEVVGVKTSLPALRGIIASPEFAAQECDTQWLEVSLPLVLDLGAKILRDVPPHNNTILKAKANTDSVAASNSGILFRKGDAWSITLTPASTDLNPSGQGDHPPSHLQLTRVLKNEFPTSLSAAITYTAPSSSPQSYIMEINTTTASAGALASSMKHRRGDNTNPEHVIIPFPGQLMEILVEEGDFIRKGDVVAVVRQMKMELEIRASRGGRVTWTFEGDEGEEVAEGLLVAIIKDTDDGTISAKL